MGNIVNTLKRFSSNDATAIPAQGCSDLSIGTSTSRLDKCTYIGNGISATGETATASKRCSINGQKDFCEEVANEGMHMTAGSTLTNRCLGALDLLSLPMVHTRPSGSEEGNKDRETSNGTVQTDARELGSVDHYEKSGLIYSQIAGHMFHSLEDESTETPRSLVLDISKDSLCKVSAEGNSFRNPNLADDVENSPATDAHRGKELILHRVSPTDGLFDRNACEELADGALNSCCECSAEVSLDGQRHEQRTQHKSLNYDAVPIEVITASANLDVSNPKSSLKGRAKQKRTPSLKGRAKRKRTTEASSQMLVPNENTGISIPSDLICLEIEKQPTSPMVKRSSGDKVLQGTPRSRMTKTPVSYVHQSPLTGSKSKAPSISTPESVNVKRSRSGRLIVPRLDPGSQNIIYDPDGRICGITNFEAQFPKGISSEPPSKRRSRRFSADHKRLLTF
ncbi:hypothetical protein SETIT_7G056600v2 [Setaria italica]|uniref:Uncharacterized protein n=1 Tax=Setaria italica TaxID=4555 RepID=K3Y788_SETIT|nr:uncharacterized protein LOC101765475 [Setaria italica]RCV33110.1 hypothetical protein SETIT_7G056600v2 [Setaria italica]